MNPTPEQIEQIVQRVMLQLRTGSSDPVRGQSVALVNRPAREEVSRHLSASVITEDLLQRETGGAGQITLDPRAVITPSGHDYLRRHALNWTRSGSNAAQPSTTGRTAILLHAAGGVITEMISGLAQQDSDCDFRLADDRKAAAEETVSRICRGENHRIILLTDHEIEACIELNRHPRLHAVAVDNHRTMTRALRQTRVNVFCVGVDETSGFELRNLVKSLLQSQSTHNPNRK